MSAQLFTPQRLVFIGLGGIGSWLVEPVIRYFQGVCNRVKLVDGDMIEKKNLARQSFSEDAVRYAKAEAVHDRMRGLFPGHELTSFPWFVEKSNVQNYVAEQCAVFLSPDNHTVRRLVSEQAQKLKTVAVFTAGNELYDGSCHVYVKNRGIELTRDFVTRHPEAKDAVAPQLGCTELINMGDVQLIAVNFLMAAAAMSAVHQVFQFGQFKDLQDSWVQLPQEVYMSITGSARTTMAPRHEVVREEEGVCSS